MRTIWDKIITDGKIELNDGPIYKKQFLKTKTKFYFDEATDFHDKEVPKVDSSYTCLAGISLDSIFGVYEKYYSQVFLKECKYIERNGLDILLMTLKILLMIWMKID